MTSEQSINCLVVVIDTSPIWWGKKMMKQDQTKLLSQSIDAIMVFCSCHLMLNQSNKLAVIAAHSHCSRMLYPHTSDALQFDETPRGGVGGMYEKFAEVQNTIREQLTDLIIHDSGDVYSDALVAGAVSRGLCYINKQSKNLPHGATMNSRVLVMQGSQDNPMQYMDLMNIISTTQKQSVVIDACVLDGDSVVLQQACDITGGTYLKIPQVSALLQYLMWVFLPESEERNKLNLPPAVHVDYRAACFCHRTMVDVGYVCSVCLSVFCTFSPICSTCQTTFKLIAPPKMVKKKAKKS